MSIVQTAMMGLSGQGQEMADQTRQEQKRAYDASKQVLEDWTRALAAATAKMNKATVGDKPARNEPMPSRGDPRYP